MTQSNPDYDMLRQRNTGVIEAPFPADEEKPFAFVSYSHRDRDRVFPIMKDLYEQGFRLWYDEGLEIGEDYYETLKKHVKECAAFILMASAQSAKSTYINEHEIPQAKGYKRPVVICFLDRGIHFDTLDLEDHPGGDPEELPRLLLNTDHGIKGSRRTAQGHQVRVDPLIADRDQLYAFDVCPGGVRLTEYKGKDTSVEIPSEYPPDTGIRVVELGNAFSSCKTLREAVIPPTVHTIGAFCFTGCGELSRLVVPGSLEYIRLGNVRSKLTEQDYCFLPNHSEQKTVLTVHTPLNSPTYRLIEMLRPYVGNPISTRPWTDLTKVRVETDIADETPAAAERTAYASFSQSMSTSVYPILNRLQDQRCRIVSEPVDVSSSRSRSFLDAGAVLAFVDRAYLREGGQDLLLRAIEKNCPVCVYKLEECMLPENVSKLDTVHQLLFNYGTERERTVKLVNWLTENGCRNEYDIAYFDYRSGAGGIRLTGCSDTARFVTVPSKIGSRKVGKLSPGIFESRDLLEHIDTDADYPYYSSRDGYLTDKQGRHLIFCPRGRKGTARIPDGRQTVGKEAFLECRALSSAAVPEGVVSLGVRCFRGCMQMAEATLPTTLRRVKKGVFEKCAALREIALPEGIVKIPKEAFFDCAALRKVRLPRGLKIIGSNSFAGCVRLESMPLPPGLKKIRHYALSKTGLTEITLPDGLRKIRIGAFDSCDKLTEVTVPGSVRAVGLNAFAKCTHLRRVTIQSGVHRLYSGAFMKCESLQSVEIPPSVRYISKDAFPKNPDMVICCRRGSHAWKYGRKNGFLTEELP